MRYLPELYYLQDYKEVPLPKAVIVTATFTAKWCDYFYAKILAPRTKRLRSWERYGSLPANLQQKELFVTNLLHWLFENSFTDELFCLRLDDKPVSRTSIVAKFDHPDDTGCWTLNLSDDQFAALQDHWRKQELPEDLFYPETNALCIPYPGTGIKSRLLRVLGIQKCYTPKQWQKTQHDKLT